MICSHCGIQNNIDEKFCKNCGSLIENTNHILNNQMYNQQTLNMPNTNNIQNSNGLNTNFINNVVNPNMKKWAISSVVVPSVGLVFYWFIGLPFYLAIIIAVAGFSFAKKGEMSNPKLAEVGKVLNGILVGLAIFMFIVQLISVFNS